MSDERQSFVFYRSFYESISDLSNEQKGAILSAICEYALDQNDPDFSGMEKAIFTLIKPQLDANLKRYDNGKKGGKHGIKGGRKNPNGTPSEPQANPTPTPNVNDNVNVNDNLKDKKNIKKPDDVSEQVFSDFLKLRKAKKAPVTETVIAGIRSEAAKISMTLEAALAMCCSRGWAGFRHDWLENPDKPPWKPNIHHRPTANPPKANVRTV